MEELLQRLARLEEKYEDLSEKYSQLQSDFDELKAQCDYDSNLVYELSYKAGLV